ncbi:MAG: preprotein translocase subunit SecG [Gammaproteobacteria bacterium]|nr:preprotein translocase subunit SecG [Gammaproteobacteria bacterium]
MLLVVQVVTAISLIGFILLQHGRGADAGAAFGSGASATVFGARGTGNFLSRTTTVLACIFLANSLALAYIARERVLAQTSVMEGAATVIREQKPEQETPQTPESPASDLPALPDE